ncbi:hypothetical protein GCM10027416_20650 [Okibacterium endophyticum]
MTLIGLTGGIASGKSLVSSRLRDLGAVIVDADVIAREVVEPGRPALERIVREFGDEVLAADGSLDRAALGAIVFSDPSKRRVLNDITHPAVRERTNEIVSAVFADDPDAVVVNDIPLLVEAGRDKNTHFDSIVVVHADTETRIRRMVEHRGMSRAEAESRIAAQASDAAREAIADVVIDNSGSVQDTMRQVDDFWAGLHGQTERQG